jgi:hypothetical protein
MHALDADGVRGADDGGEVLRLVHGVHEDREVGLTTVEGVLELGESLGCHPILPWISEQLKRLPVS